MSLRLPDPAIEIERRDDIPDSCFQRVKSSTNDGGAYLRCMMRAPGHCRAPGGIFYVVCPRHMPSVRAALNRL